MAAPVTLPRHLVILGPPGAGKGTQAAHLARHFGVAHLSTGAMLRRAMEAGTDLGGLARPFVESGALVPDEVMLRVVEHALEWPVVVEQGFILDGFPRTAEQAESLLAARPGRIDAAIRIALPPDEARRRLLARGRGDDRPEVVEHRLAVDAEEAGPLLDLLRSEKLLIEVDGGADEPTVFERILNSLAHH